MTKTDEDGGGEISMQQLKQIMIGVKYNNTIPRDAFMKQVADVINYKVENGKITAHDGVKFLQDFVKTWNEL